MNEKEKQHFVEIIEQIKDLRLRKSADYGSSWKIFGLKGVIYQIASKFIRIWNLTGKEIIPENESLRDSFIDMANYAIMAAQLLDMGKIEETFTKDFTTDDAMADQTKALEEQEIKKHW